MRRQYNVDIECKFHAGDMFVVGTGFRPLWSSADIDDVDVIDTLTIGDLCVIISLDQKIVDNEQITMARVISSKGTVGWTYCEDSEML